MRQLRLAKEDPVPNIDIRMYFWTLEFGAFAACTTALAEWDMRNGGDVVAAKGFPEVRVWPSVLMMMTGPVVRERAVLTAADSRGEPLEIVRLARGGRDEDDRIRATTLWPRFSAECRTRLPVRPVAPMRRMSGRLVELLSDMVDDEWFMTSTILSLGIWAVAEVVLVVDEKIVN